MSIIGAVIAGIVGTLVLSMVMALGPKMGMPKMDMVEMLGSMFNAEGNRTLGWIIHLMMGVVFAFGYALLWSLDIGSVSIISGVVFGSIHWLGAGLMMGGMPMMHAGIKSGKVQAPGVFMLSNGGMMAFMGGLMGHIIFGIVVVLVYGLFV